jgi:hypothetical protein
MSSSYPYYIGLATAAAGLVAGAALVYNKLRRKPPAADPSVAACRHWYETEFKVACTRRNCSSGFIHHQATGQILVVAARRHIAADEATGVYLALWVEYGHISRRVWYTGDYTSLLTGPPAPHAPVAEAVRAIIVKRLNIPAECETRHVTEHVLDAVEEMWLLWTSMYGVVAPENVTS